MYTVSYSKAGNARKEIGQFDELTTALAAAEDAGAIVEAVEQRRYERMNYKTYHYGAPGTERARQNAKGNF